MPPSPSRFTAAAVTLLLAACSTTAALDAAGPGPATVDEAGGLPAGYRLVWSDEFDAGTLPDRTKWAYDTHRNRLGWYNNERQYYADERAENARIENGMLVITARKESTDAFADAGGQEYTSARLFTKDRRSWTYGFFEIRAKLPCGLGTWPAIWTLADSGGWPDGGEIDIMEHVGFEPGVVHGSVHTKAYHHSIHTHRTAKVTRPDVCGAFHRYQLTWTAQRITVGIDDRNYFSFRNGGTGDRRAWPFDRPQHLLLNIAVGGDWGGQRGVNPRAFPVAMEVDYVRVYQPAK
jgi:beta-glucanase (GH16 family)